MANFSIFHVYVFLGFVSAVLTASQFFGLLGAFQRVPFFPERECLRLYDELVNELTFTPDDGYETLLLNCDFPHHESLNDDDYDAVVRACEKMPSVICVLTEKKEIHLRFCKGIKIPVDKAYYFDGTASHSLDIERSDELIKLTE